jgi:uncharacterized protein YndB with AHSA1/START domain
VIVGLGSLITPVVFVLVALAIDGCGTSRATLDRLAAAGSIDEGAPVKTHRRIEIAAPPARVWGLIVNARSWPEWQKDIQSVAVAGPLTTGMRFSWTTGGTRIQSQVQLCEAPNRLSWTGTALTAKAVHVWELKPESGDQTLVIIKESMNGPFIAGAATRRFKRTVAQRSEERC